jgi:hypothetical protein
MKALMYANVHVKISNKIYLFKNLKIKKLSKNDVFLSKKIWVQWTLFERIQKMTPNQAQTREEF